MNNNVNINATKSTVATGGSIVQDSNTNSNSGNISIDRIIINKARKTAFWVSLIVGILSSLISTLIFEYLIRS